MDGGGGNRAEAERWLYTANKLLSARDLYGARSLAIRARESDPTFDASELVLTVIDTLLAGDALINNRHRDWYGILQVHPYNTSIDHIAAHYRRLALLLDPHRNPFALAGHAFSLVHDAWCVLSNPAKKAMYDSDLRLLTTPPPAMPPPQPQPQPMPPPPPQQQQPQPHTQSTPRENPSSREEPTRQNSNGNESTESTRQTRTENVETQGNTSFWTSCPYCYVLYEYPKVYEECTLRCQSCRRGFHAAVIRSPPLNGRDASYCSWGFIPLGFSGDSKDINGSSSNWNPFSPLFPCPLKESRKPQKSWDYYDDEAAAAFIEFSDPSEDDSSDGDWRGGGKRGRKRTRVRRKKGSGGVSREPVGRPRRSARFGAVEQENVSSAGPVDAAGAGSAVPSGARAESSKKAVPAGSRRRGAGNLGKLDLNVEFSNEAEEPSRGHAHREGHATGNAEDNIEGIGFFEGLDEFLNSLPILNVVAGDKVKGH